jgi:hypothetical protein
MKKKYLIPLFLLLPIIVSAAEKVNGIYYVFYTKTATVVSGKDKYVGDIKIPSSVEYTPFKEKKVYEVNTIGKEAFYGCKEMTSLSIPNTVTLILGGAFQNCSGLTKLDIPDNIKAIYEKTFYGCSGLTKLVIPKSVTNIEDWAFAGCKNLTSISLPENITEISKFMLADCQSLISIEIPKSVNTIKAYAFYNCSSLTSLSLPKTLTEIEERTFYYCTSLLSIEIPSTVNKIGDRAFEECNSLTSIEIGSGIQNINKLAFASCTSLKELYCFAKNVPSTESDSFKDTNIKDVFLYVPSESINSYRNASPWKDFKQVVAIGSKPIFKLTYMIDGVEYKTVEYECGAKITPEPVPDGDYASFKWEDIPTTMPDHDVTVNAKYVVNTYTLTYMIDDKVYKTVTYAYGDVIVPEPAPKGYATFEWEGIPSTMPKEDVTVNAKYTIAKYKLIYMLDGEVYKVVEYEYGSEITPESAPDGDFSSFEWEGIPETMPDQDVTVYAKYSTNKYTLTYMIDGKVYKTVEYEFGETIIPEPAPNGYASIEWEGLPSTMPKEDITVNAKYTLAKFKLTYMIDGEVYKTVEYEYGATIEEEPAPEGNYSSFKWVGIPSTMPDHDVVVTAEYTKPPKAYKMIVSLKSGEHVSFILIEKPEITFTSVDLVVTTGLNKVDYLRADISDFHFEEIETGIASICYKGLEEVKIYNMSGLEVASLKGGSVSEAKLLLNSYKPGAYIIKVGNKVTIKYLVK